MCQKLLNILTFTLAIGISLCSAGILVAYVVFESNSGWQEGFALVFSIQAGVLAVAAGLAFALSNALFRTQISAVRAAVLGGITANTAIVLGALLLVGGLSGIASIWLSYLALVVGAFCFPLAFRTTGANETIRPKRPQE